MPFLLLLLFLYRNTIYCKEERVLRETSHINDCKILERISLRKALPFHTKAMSCLILVINRGKERETPLRVSYTASVSDIKRKCVAFNVRTHLHEGTKGEEGGIKMSCEHFLNTTVENTAVRYFCDRFKLKPKISIPFLRRQRQRLPLWIIYKQFLFKP